MKDITVFSSIESVRVYVKGLLHIHFLRSEYVGLSSWYVQDKQFVSRFCIEITLKTTKISLEYEDPKIWEEILKKLDTIL